MTFAAIYDPIEVRPDILDAFSKIWQTIASPGNWWHGADRVAIAAECRSAVTCSLCEERKEALSPNFVKGEHQAVSNLPMVAIDAVHRITMDVSRLTKTWLEQCREAGLSDAQYVELLGIVVAVVSIDGFHRAMGLPLEPLPEPQDGEPSAYRPDAKDHGAWVDTVNPADLSDEEADIYGGVPQVGNVFTAMSLVPDSVRMLSRLSAVQYLEASDVVNPTFNGGRALSRMQMELLAGRVSSLSDCFY
ncbi:MAG: hypothetical protein CMQ20_17620 [Gammaproteobacteria bacterium]|jgi:hypothetical protein|nr:hypothetical protein [Gammaproteobacteria bacterium]|tara:strand:+ start:2231 stop:2971 length:741 start_codon:yes stop_codon:yes gene_type:complete